MKYIKKFDTISAQTEYLNSADIDTYVGYVSENETVYYDDAIPNYSEQYFTIESLDDNNVIYLRASAPMMAKTISASTDNGETWTEYASSYGSSGTTIATLNAGDKVLLKGLNSAYGKGPSGHNKIVTSGKYNVYGNIMSLIYGDNFAGQTVLTSDFTFFKLFLQSKIVSARNLIMPATTLVENCYYMMFSGCNSLTTAPTLPATTLVEGCYYCMFDYTINLNYIKCLATDISARYCTYNWARAVASTGTFVKAASMNDWTSGNNGIPANWTIENE